jgi:branched-chain amino acid transport system permease protein
MIRTIVQLVVNGVLLGGIYALISTGLTLIWGVMQIMNFAHGEYLMLGMYASFWLFHFYGINPYLSILFVAPILFVLGVLTQRAIIKPILGGSHLAQVFATMGLSIALQNLALFLWKADYRSIRVVGSISNLRLHGVIFSLPWLIAFIITMAMMIILFLFLKKTYIGKAMRATSENRRAAQLMGINVDRVYYLAMGIGSACVGVAGAVLAPMYPVFPTVGGFFVIVAFVIVVLGGLGNITGALVGSLILGVVETFSGFYIAVALKEFVYFLVFILILLLRPAGLLGKATTR